MNNFSLAPYNHQARHLNIWQKIGLSSGTISIVILMLAFIDTWQTSSAISLFLFLLFNIIGIASFTMGSYRNTIKGINNDGVWFNSLMNRGSIGWCVGIVLTTFYVLLYWYPTTLGLGQNEANNTGLIAVFDPITQWIHREKASQWFMYGFLYTLAILGMGIKFIYKYRHNKYQVIRTISVMIFQLAFAFIIPEILAALNQPYFDFKNMWPLNYYFFFDWQINSFLSSGSFGIFMLIWGIVMIIVISPVLTYFYGKRWYCSWVCGCGGLAETAGDPFRQLSDTSLKAWKIERWMIHSVLVFAIVMTGLVLASYFTGKAEILGINSYAIREWYGFLIGAAFSGVIGVGFYPILGNRVWCRFGCPMAAILGIQQKFFSRFRITTNGGQCISCGNCSTYCEMGIDVRAYAQKGQDIVRASCVGCGICAAVCPRGVLRLENGSDTKGRAQNEKVLHIRTNDILMQP